MVAIDVLRQPQLQEELPGVGGDHVAVAEVGQHADHRSGRKEGENVIAQKMNSDWVSNQLSLPVEAGLVRVAAGVVVGAELELEVAEVVGRDVYVDFDVLARPVLARDDAVGEGAARRLVQPRARVPRVAADPALAPEGLLVL